MHWEWMGDKTQEIDDTMSFKTVLLCAYDMLCETLPHWGGEAYTEVVGKAINAGLGHRQAEAFSALYFTLNHDKSPVAQDIALGDEYVPFDSLLDDAVAWFHTHKDQEPMQSLRVYAEYSLRDSEQTQAENKIDRTNSIRVVDIIYPLDKVNSNIWSLKETDTRGQLRIGVEKQGSRKELNILYSINFDDLGDNLRISKRLTQYDKRVYIAVSGLFNAGNDVITLHQIYTAMGGTGNPSDDQREKISTAIAKMQSAMINVDNSMEAADYNYTKFVYRGYLLPIERVKRIVNGNLVEEAIHIFREPPVMTFAKQRKQITTIPVQLLNSPISKTNANLAIEDYLLERISRAKDGHSPCKILYKTICDKAGAVTAKQRQRVPEKVGRYLTNYAEKGFIASFKTAADGVTISF